MSLLGFFIAHPWLALLIAAAFALAWRRQHSALAAAATVLWAAYGIYEYAVLARLLCSGDCNIRIDLLLVYPVLLVVSVLAVISMVRSRARRMQRVD